MRFLPLLVLIVIALPCWAQPTGHQKLFFLITDNRDTLHFENKFKKNSYESKSKLSYKNYQLIDVSKNSTGFNYNQSNGCIHKTLMNKDHKIIIVKNGSDTMLIELLNTFRVYFMSIPFQKGHFRFYLNDGNENKWNVNTLPFKTIDFNQYVYDISPKDWSAFQVKNTKSQSEYFVSVQFEKQELLE